MGEVVDGRDDRERWGGGEVVERWGRLGRLER